MGRAAFLVLFVIAVGNGGAAPVDAQSGSDARAGTPAAQSAGQAPDASAKSLDELKKSAGKYRIELSSEPRRELVRVAEPVLRWTNPLRGSVGGATFLWIADGRPEAIGSLYRYTEAGQIVEDDEFQSLAFAGLAATREGQPVWVPPGAGIVLAPIPNAPRPADTAAARLRQMHALVKEFRAFLDNREDKTELRLLPKPLYRYEAKRQELADGALFAFVLTTDPEVLLVIEDRLSDGATQWQYGFARMSMVNLRATHKDREVWRKEWATDFRNPGEPYVTLRVATAGAE